MYMHTCIPLKLLILRHIQQPTIFYYAKEKLLDCTKLIYILTILNEFRHSSFLS